MAATRAFMLRAAGNFISRHTNNSCHRYLSTLVLAEHEGGALKVQTLSAVAAANSLSEGNSVSLLLAGSGPTLHKAATHAASCHPSVSQVLVADSDKFRHPLAEPWAKLVHMVQQNGRYSHIIAASGSFGKNILPRAAALLDVSPVTDVTEISESRTFVRPIYAGNALCTVRYTGSDPCMLTIRATSFSAVSSSDDSKSNTASIDKVDLSTFGEDVRSRYIQHTSQQSERPDLGNARVVITGGRALKSAENFKMIEKLAEKLGAAVGATRAAVDAGYVPNDLQVGQTGKIVAPELYMAFGVSGAIQHLAGMRDSKVIVAVNKDADAPIFQVADYGLVGDLFEVIPELIEKLRCSSKQQQQAAHCTSTQTQQPAASNCTQQQLAATTDISKQQQQRSASSNSEQTHQHAQMSKTNAGTSSKQQMPLESVTPMPKQQSMTASWNQKLSSYVQAVQQASPNASASAKLTKAINSMNTCLGIKKFQTLVDEDDEAYQNSEEDDATSEDSKR